MPSTTAYDSVASVWILMDSTVVLFCKGQPPPHPPLPSINPLATGTDSYFCGGGGTKMIDMDIFKHFR